MIKGKTMADTTKCFFCNRKFEQSKVIIGFEGFTHCPLCGAPLFDIYIQDPDHWIWQYLNARQKREFGYFDKIKEIDDD